MKKIVFASLLCLFLTACDRPQHVVFDGKLVIYHAEQLQNQKYGKYEYWVRDGSSKGWTYRTDDVLNVGDELIIIIKK